MNKKILAMPLALMFFYLWFNSFGRAVLPVHLLSQGISITGQVFSIILIFLTQALIVLFFRKYQSRWAWSLSCVFSLAYILLSINLINVFQLYLASAISGLGLGLFWVSYNIVHFKNTHKKDIGVSSGWMFSFFPAINIAAPLLAGFLAEANITLVWALTIVFFLAPLLVIKQQENLHVNYSVREALDSLKPIRWFIFIEGIWEAVVFCIIPIYTLFFLQTPGYYATFLAYLSAGLNMKNLLTIF